MPEVRALVLEHRGTYAESAQKGTLLTLEELPRFLKAGLRDLESTEHYEKYGFVWFYLRTRDTPMSGFYKFNEFGETLEEMFQQVTEDEYYQLPLHHRAYFNIGMQPLAVGIDKDPRTSGRKIGIFGFNAPQQVAPITVVKEAGPIAAVKRQSEPDEQEADTHEFALV